MKSVKLVVLVLCGVFLLSGSALAIPMLTVGGVDTLDSWTTLSNSGKEEQAWISNTFEANAVVDVYDTVATDWELVDGTISVYAYALPYESPDFFIKVGVGQTGLATHMYYINNSELSYAVIDLNDWSTTLGVSSRAVAPSDFNIGRVSHVGAPVPEPSTIVLLGLGLLGLAGIGRKKLKY